MLRSLTRAIRINLEELKIETLGVKTVLVSQHGRRLKSLSGATILKKS